MDPGRRTALTVLLPLKEGRRNPRLQYWDAPELQVIFCDFINVIIGYL